MLPAVTPAIPARQSAQLRIGSLRGMRVPRSATSARASAPALAGPPLCAPSISHAGGRHPHLRRKVPSERPAPKIASQIVAGTGMREAFVPSTNPSKRDLRALPHVVGHRCSLHVNRHKATIATITALRGIGGPHGRAPAIAAAGRPALGRKLSRRNAIHHLRGRADASVIGGMQDPAEMIVSDTILPQGVPPALCKPIACLSHAVAGRWRSALSCPKAGKDVFAPPPIPGVFARRETCWRGKDQACARDSVKKAGKGGSIPLPASHPTAQPRQREVNPGCDGRFREGHRAYRRAKNRPRAGCRAAGLRSGTRVFPPAHATRCCRDG